MNECDKQGLSEEVMRRVAHMYGVRVAAFGPIEKGYRNASYSFTTEDERWLNFILYKKEPGIVELIRRTNAFGRHAASGLPVRAPADERILRVGSRYGSLYKYLPGETIPWEAYSMKHIKLLGFSLAQFHAAAKDFDRALPDVETVYKEIDKRMRRYFSETGVKQAMTQKLGLTIVHPKALPFLDQMKKVPTRIPLHMDFVRSNVLFKTATSGDKLTVGSVALSGILDLEKAAYGHVLFDVARTLAFLLVDCNKPPEKIYKYFLSSGYEKRGGGLWFFDEYSFAVLYAGWTFPVQRGDTMWHLEPSEAKRNTAKSYSFYVLEQLVTMFLIYDFYKFLKQNPYESLSENHHFLRTVAILRARKVLQ